MKKTFKIIARIITIFMLIMFIIVGGTVGYFFWDNNRVVNTTYSVQNEKIPDNFQNYKITMVSDFHNGKNYNQVIKAVKKAAPNIICITGDLVDYDTKDFTNTNKLVAGLKEITDVYYVYGNHEMSNKAHNSLEQPEIHDVLKDSGIIFLNNRFLELEKNGEYINLAGYGDDIYSDMEGHFRPNAKNNLTALGKKINNDNYTILLMHRPQYFDTLSALPYYDLYLCGHLHGGLINLPKIKEQILQMHFGTDKYCKGEYSNGGKEMIISAGLAKEEMIPRVLNTPEITTVTLKTDK